MNQFICLLLLVATLFLATHSQAIIQVPKVDIRSVDKPQQSIIQVKPVSQNPSNTKIIRAATSLHKEKQATHKAQLVPAYLSPKNDTQTKEGTQAKSSQIDISDFQISNSSMSDSPVNESLLDILNSELFETFLSSYKDSSETSSRSEDSESSSTSSSDSSNSESSSKSQSESSDSELFTPFGLGGHETLAESSSESEYNAEAILYQAIEELMEKQENNDKN